MLSRMTIPLLMLPLLAFAACDKGDEHPMPAATPASPTPVLGTSPALVPPGLVTPIPTATPEPTISSGEVKQEIKEAADATGTYLSDRGRELKAWSRERMDNLRADIARLKLKAQAHADNSDTSALDKIQARLGELDQHMADFADSSAEKFNEARENIDAELADMRLKVSEMMNRDTDTTNTQTQ